MVCGILPRGQNLNHGKGLSRQFLDKFNETAGMVNRALRQVEMHIPWMKYLDIPGFMCNYG